MEGSRQASGWKPVTEQPMAFSELLVIRPSSGAGE